MVMPPQKLDVAVQDSLIPRNLLEASRFTPKEIIKFRIVQVISIVSLFFAIIAMFLPLMHFQWFNESIIDYLSIALFFQSSVVSETVGFPMAFVFLLSIPSFFIAGVLFHVTYRKKYLVFQSFMLGFLTFPTLFFLIILEIALSNKTRNLLDVGVTRINPTRFFGSALGEASWLLLMSFVLSIIAVSWYDIQMKDKIEGYYKNLKIILTFSSSTRTREYT